MNIFTAILDCLSIGYVEALKNLQKVLAKWMTVANLLLIKDCSGGNNSPSQHSLRRAVSFSAMGTKRVE
jgi:hypothetical protein